MSDYIVRATAADGGIRAYAVTAKEMVETARRAHQTTPVMTAALGRLLCAGAMMGVMGNGDGDLLTLQILCDGPAGGLVVTADAFGHVKGYAQNPSVDLPPKAPGKLDVGGAVGSGTLFVIRDLHLKEPYIGQCDLISGEIAEDLTYYFAASEQIPSSVGLGVLVGRDGCVQQAGGFILQLMPDVSDEVIDLLQERLLPISSVTEMLQKGLSPEDILADVLGDLSLTVLDTMPAEFRCDCSKSRIAQALSTLNRRDLADLVADGEEIEVRCQFCGRTYAFGPDDLMQILSAGEADAAGKQEETDTPLTEQT